MSNINDMGYTMPTPIQAAAMPAVLEGRDVMGLAQTGTGKTAAFVLPILTAIMNRPPKGPGPRALIVAPTRELAEQIHQAVREMGKGVRFRSVVIYGGVGMYPQTRALRQGVDIVVACPGRLLDHMGQGNVRFPHLETLVLDEADHMFDMGFLPDIRKILSQVPASRQTLLFSATMPDSIRGLANDILRDPEVVNVGRLNPPAMVSHAVYPVESSRKTPMLLALLGQAGKSSVIVFTRTKHRAKNLAVALRESGHRAACIQGNLSQSQRQQAMDGFRKGTYQVLVATDIAARGIDVSKVGHVINYDIPDTPEAYIHRIGRTGRAECEGAAHTLITMEDRSMVRAIEGRLGKRLDRQSLPGFPAPDLDRPGLPSSPASPYRQDRTGRRPSGGSGGRPFQSRSDSRTDSRSGRPERRSPAQGEYRVDARPESREATGQRTEPGSGYRAEPRSGYRSEPRTDDRSADRRPSAQPARSGPAQDSRPAPARERRPVRQGEIRVDPRADRPVRSATAVKTFLD